MKNKETKILFVLLLIAVISFMIVTQIIINQQNKRIDGIESKVFSPVIIERTDDDTIKSERTHDLVQQAYEKINHDSWFDYAYKIDYGANEYGQLLIFVTFYYSKVNDTKNYQVTLVNYYQAPDVNEWEVIE